MQTGTTRRFARHYWTYLRRKTVQHLVLHVTNHCNFRCKHCFVDFTPKKDLPLEIYQRLGKDVGPLFWLDVGGGEPFLRKDLPEILASFDTRVLHIPTNGSMGEKTLEAVRRIRAHSSADLGISLSLDGLQATHDKVRNQPGNWNQIWETFEELRKIQGIAVYINTVLMDQNEAEILELMDYVWNHRPDFHAIAILRGGPVAPRTTTPELNRLRRLGPKIHQRIARYETHSNPLMRRVSRNYHRYLWKISLQTLEQRTQVLPCLAGSAHQVVWANGDVASCEMLPPVGNLLKQNWSEIQASSAMRSQRASIRAKECHCTHNCALFDSIMFRPASLPHLIHTAS